MCASPAAATARRDAPKTPVVQRTANMAHATNRTCLFLVWCLALTAALPTSVVEEVKSNDITNKKVKRAQASIVAAEEGPKESAGYFSPTPIKRGINLKTDQLPLLTEWDQQRYRQADSMPSPLYLPEEELDDKSLAEYEKGYRYGTSKDKLDEALENAILKSELYGDPAAVNQYRYFGNDDRRRRKRRNVQKMRMSNRFKRQVELSPEDILAILTLWENERERSPSSYRSWQRFDPGYDADAERDDTDADRNDEDWMDAPVYPHISEHLSPMSPNYYYDAKPAAVQHQDQQQVFEKRGRWGGFSPEPTASKKKRFMVAKKRNDPTREIRYLNGPTRNDFYTLSELLGSQRDPAVPMYQRYVL